MDKVLSRLKWHMCLVYLDDVLVFGKNFQEHQERLELVLMALEKAGLTLNVEKCVFATSRVEHLGHVIDGNGIRPHPDKVQALVNFKTHDVKSLRRFNPDFAAVSSPLYGSRKMRLGFGRRSSRRTNRN